MLSIIVTAYKEERNIGNLINSLLNEKFSGLGEGTIDKSWEFILVAPDKPTRDAAINKLKLLGVPSSKYTILKDNLNGKPNALNMCFKVSKGDYLFLTDGDIELSKNTIKYCVSAVEESDNIGGISVRPISGDGKNSMMAYWGNLLADAAHHKRSIDLTEDSLGHSRKLIPKRKFFPLSGYGMLIKNIGWNLPKDVLVDDAYISYKLYNEGYKLGYAPKANAIVKYPKSLSDYYKQKKRSTGGYIQLWKYNIVSKDTKTRSFWRELEYFWFPIKYAGNFKELLWSVLLYPTRLWLWLVIFWERVIIKKDFKKTWVRIESTK